MTLFEIIKIIKDISLLQPNVRTASNGDIFDSLNGNPNVKYGVVHINQTTHNETETTDNYGLNVFYVDRLEVDKNNQLQIQSTGKNIIGNIIHTLCEQFDVDCPNITYTPFTERFKDECAGVYANLTIQIVKDYSCAEQYGEWVKPQITVINNIDATFTENGIYKVPKGYSGFGTVEVAIDYNAIEDKAFQEGYLEGETVGYNDGYVEGVDDQKSLLESIIITENGVYTKEDGYNEITVEVPDLNGSYDEGYNVGYDEGLNDAGEVIAETAQVLNITQNGTYYTKYSDVTPVNDGNLIKTVNVQVDKGVYLPNGVSFKDSTFEEFDFDNSKLKYVNTFNNFFCNCKNLRKIKNFRPTNKCSCEQFFKNTKDDTIGDYTIELENCDFSNVIDAVEFFDGSPFNREDFDCSNFNFNKLVATKWMFRNMNKIVTLNLKNWDVTNLSLVDGMFDSCNNLEHIYTSSWGEMKVGTTERMFYNCRKLKEVNMPYLISQYTTGLFQLFTGCVELEYIDTTNWDFSNVGDTRYLFNNCKKLNFDFSKFNTKKIYNAEYMFSNSGFEKIEMDVDNMEIGIKMFENCYSLTEVKFRGNPKKLSNVSNMFNGIKTSGVLYYPQEYDYSKIINVLPSTWTAIPY